MQRIASKPIDFQCRLFGAIFQVAVEFFPLFNPVSLLSDAFIPAPGISVPGASFNLSPREIGTERDVFKCAIHQQLEKSY